MWCPKCKIEYRKGITICADCGSELIERDGEYGVDICEISDEAVADEIVDFLIYSGVEGVLKEPNDDASSFKITVPEKAERKAERLVKGYLIAKEEEKEKQEEVEALGEAASGKDDFFEDSEETGQSADAFSVEAGSSEDTADTDNTLFSDEVENTTELLYTSNKKEYVKMKDKYRDMKFSGITFIIFGILGALYLTLSKLEIIPIEYNIFVFCVIAALFAAFIISGIVSCVKAKKYRLLIPEEEEKTAAIKKWLEENLTSEMIEGWSDSNASDGENDLLITAHIRTLLIHEYPTEEEGYLELMADEYYEEHFFNEESAEE